MTTLENEHLKVIIKPLGAEIISLYNKASKIEHIWQAEPDVWGWHAPNLFPVVGGCINDQVLIDGNTYPMNRHGFARHSDFILSESTDTQAKFSLINNAKLQDTFPYKCTFQVLYELSGQQLRVTFKVINDDHQTIYFSVGAHPAFNLPFTEAGKLEDYYLEFEEVEPLRSHLLSSAGFFTGEVENVPTESNKLYITEQLFSKDALVFKDLKSRKVALKSKNHSHSIVMYYPNFPYLGLWAKPGAPFLCIEPWIGCADTAGKTVEFSEKEGTHSLEKGHVFEADFIIGIH
jgi:galactose mutarotase-like enzyme